MMYRTKGHRNVRILSVEFNERELWNKGKDGIYRLVRREENISDRELLLEMAKVCDSLAKGDRLEIVSYSEMNEMSNIA